MPEPLTWDAVPGEVVRLIKLAAPLVPRLVKVVRRLRSEHPAMPGYGKVWLNPDTHDIFFNLGDSDEKPKYDAWTSALSIPDRGEIRSASEGLPPVKHGPWVPIKSADVNISDIFSVPAQATGIKSGPLNALWGGPRPLADMLAGGAVGAGAGYGAGWLAEHVLPGHLANRRLRKSLAVLGGMLGAVPGAAQTADNWSQGESPLAPWPPPVKKATLLERVHTTLDEYCPPAEKIAAPMSAMTDFVPFIDRDGLNQLILRDRGMSQALSAATIGLVDGASELRGGARWISPFDIGRMAMGMGTGMVSGLIVGRTLGALTGLSPEAQQQLTRAGVLAGLLTNVVPMALYNE